MPHFVKRFDINGVKARQVACIELHGKPNAATKGAIGVLGIDMDSPTHEMYKCVAVNGGIYTWEEVSAGTGSETKIVPFTIMNMGTFYYCATSVPFDEIYQAYQDGMTVVATDGSSNYYYLSTISESEVKFVRAYYDGANIVVDTIAKTSTTSSFAKGSVVTGEDVAPTKVINITGTVGMSGISYSCGATTFSDITTAYSNGRVVVARVTMISTTQPTIYYLTDISATNATFSSHTHSGESITVTTFKIDNTNKVSQSTTTVSSSSGGSGGLGEPDFMGEPIITDAGFYAVCAVSADESIIHNFGVFYYEPYEHMQIYAGLTRLLINWDTGELTIEECTQTIEGNTVVNTYTDVTSNYEIYVAKLS